MLLASHLLPFKIQKGDFLLPFDERLKFHETEKRKATVCWREKYYVTNLFGEEAHV